ncbi:glycosyltransferase family 4 protein [bacterium]|nr:glycosyltransferase family 4 protein [bacterium]
MPTRVLMFGWEFPPHNSGGLGTACLGLSRSLAREGIDITFVLPREVSAEAPADNFRFVFADVPNIRVKCVHVGLYPYITSESYEARQKGAASPYAGSLMEEVRRYAELARVIAREENFDIIHAHDWLSFPAGVAAKEVSGKPLVAHLHATEFDRTGGNGINTAVYAMEKAGMEAANRVIAVSGRTKRMAEEHYGISGDKIDVVHNGIDPNPAQGSVYGGLKKLKEDGANIVLFAGRITLQKGPDYFVKAARRVFDVEPNVYFVVAGSGDMERQMMQEAAYMGLGSRFIFAGFLRGTELDAVYKIADLYVMPSVSEPFGITPLESLAQGTPVLISKQSGVSEVLRHSLRADFWDIDDIADKIVSALRHPPLHSTLAENGMREIRDLTWENAAQKVAATYRTILSAPAFV